MASQHEPKNEEALLLPGAGATRGMKNAPPSLQDYVEQLHSHRGALNLFNGADARGGPRARKAAAIAKTLKVSRKGVPQKNGKTLVARANDANETRARVKFRGAVRSERSIRKAQDSTDLLIPKAVVRRLCREIAYDVQRGPDELRFSKAAFEILHCALEQRAIEEFAAAQQITDNARRVTLYARDMQVLKVVAKIIKNGGGVIPRVVYMQEIGNGKRKLVHMR